MAQVTLCSAKAACKAIRNSAQAWFMMLPDMYQSVLPTKTGNYCFCVDLYIQCCVPEPYDIKGSFQAVVISGCRLQDSRLYVGWQSLEVGIVSRGCMFGEWDIDYVKGCLVSYW